MRGSLGACAAWLVVATVARADAGDLTLERAVQLAVERNEGARATVERARAADARVDKARSFFFPDVKLTGGYTRRAFEGPIDIATGDPSRRQNALASTAALDVKLFDASAFPLYRQSKLDRAAADLRAVDARRLVGFDAALAFLGVLGTEQVVVAAERRVDLARTSLAQARSRAAAGLAGSNDVTRAELEAASGERDLARARGDVESARLTLGHLVGAPVSGRLVVPETLLADAGQPSRSVDALVASGRERLDVAAAEKSADALEASSDEPLLRTVPTLSLNGTARASNETVTFGHKTDASVGVTLTWILWDGGERYADRDERIALARAGDLDAEGAARLAELEVRDASSALLTGQETARQAEVAVRAAEQNSRETSELYRSGLAPAFAVADAGAQLFAAEVDLVTARYGLAQTLLELRRAAGLDPFGQEVR